LLVVIASDIRQLEHIEYTPAPDIIHEGAGHAPVSLESEYLRRFGEMNGLKPISSDTDYQMCEPSVCCFDSGSRRPPGNY
jgi:phenylalanine-4-hydroxylase